MPQAPLTPQGPSTAPPSAGNISLFQVLASPQVVLSQMGLPQPQPKLNVPGSSLWSPACDFIPLCGHSSCPFPLTEPEL
jgi:hypothetical protein